MSDEHHQQEQTDDVDTYIQTTTQNYVSRQAQILNPSKVELKGRSIIQRDCILDGTHHGGFIRIGRYCMVDRGTQIRPPTQPGSSGSTDAVKKHVPVTVGSHVFIGKYCMIEAASIGTYCYIGNRVRLGQRVIIKDNCYIADGAVIGDDTVVPPFTRIAGNKNNNNNSSSSTTSPRDKQQQQQQQPVAGTSHLNTSFSNNATYHDDVYRWCIPECTELPPSTSMMMQEQTTQIYQQFVIALQQSQSQQASAAW